MPNSFAADGGRPSLSRSAPERQDVGRTRSSSRTRSRPCLLHRHISPSLPRAPRCPTNPRSSAVCASPHGRMNSRLPDAASGSTDETQGLVSSGLPRVVTFACKTCSSAPEARAESQSVPHSQRSHDDGRIGLSRAVPLERRSRSRWFAFPPGVSEECLYRSSRIFCPRRGYKEDSALAAVFAKVTAPTLDSAGGIRGDHGCTNSLAKDSDPCRQHVECARDAIAHRRSGRTCGRLRVDYRGQGSDRRVLTLNVRTGCSTAAADRPP